MTEKARVVNNLTVTAQHDKSHLNSHQGLRDGGRPLHPGHGGPGLSSGRGCGFITMRGQDVIAQLSGVAKSAVTNGAGKSRGRSGADAGGGGGGHGQDGDGEGWF